MTRTEADEARLPRCTRANWHTERSLLGYQCRDVGGLIRARIGDFVGVEVFFFFLFCLCYPRRCCDCWDVGELEVSSPDVTRESWGKEAG